jgi:streptogramin lyase
MKKRIILFASAIAVVISGCGHGTPAVPSAGGEPYVAIGPGLGFGPDAGVVAKNFVASFLNQNVFNQGSGGRIVTGPDDNLYVLGFGDGDLLQINPSGVQTNAWAFGISNNASLNSGINKLLWYGGGSALDSMSTTGTLNIISLPDNGRVTAVIKGSDGNEWFAQSSPSSVGFITPGGKITEYSLPPADNPVGLAVGGDKNIWFIDNATNSFARVTPLGVVTEFAISTACAETVNYVDATIVKDGAGNLWASGSCGTGLDFFESSISGGISVFGVSSDANQLLLGPDGQIWGTNSANQPPKLLRFDVANHTETAVTLPHNANAVGGITLGPDGDIWLTTYNATTGNGYINVYDETLYTIGVRLNGELPFNDPNYGIELGYAVGGTTQSQTISVSAGESILFHNYDTIPHTASFLGDATMNNAPWPLSFSGGKTASPAGTAIGVSAFSTGTIAAGSNSRYYETGAPGFYMIGDGYDYNADKMRTVIVVH